MQVPTEAIGNGKDELRKLALSLHARFTIPRSSRRRPTGQRRLEGRAAEMPSLGGTGRSEAGHSRSTRPCSKNSWFNWRMHAFNMLQI